MYNSSSLSLFNNKLSCGIISVLALIATAGCNNQSSLIQNVTFTPSSDLTSLKIALIFSPTITSDFGGGFDVKNYGSLFVTPSGGASQPFEIGFNLNTSVVNDQDYVKLTPTSVLPNGTPMGLPYPLVQVQSLTPINKAFDLYGYIDVTNASWLGAAAIFTFMNDKNFPNGLSLTQVFLRDKTNNPGVIGTVFGPKVNPDGTLAQSGGIAVFANVRQLLTNAKPGVEMALKPEPKIYLNGPEAAVSQGTQKNLVKMQEKLIDGLNDSEY